MVAVFDAIIQIRTKTYEYYVMAGICGTNVEIAYHNGNPYLKTDRGTTTADNLLSLPDVPKKWLIELIAWKETGSRHLFAKLFYSFSLLPIIIPPDHRHTIFLTTVINYIHC